MIESELDLAEENEKLKAGSLALYEQIAEQTRQICALTLEIEKLKKEKRDTI